MPEIVAKKLGALAWAFAILLGGAILFTPIGPVPIVTKLLAILGMAAGGAAYATGAAGEKWRQS